MDKRCELSSLYTEIQADPFFLGTSKLGKIFVPGVGNPDSRIVFIGEAPGRDEELQQQPFVGAAGQNLNTLLSRIGLSREQVFITNLVKFRPFTADGANRKPTTREASAGRKYLVRELEILAPAWVVCLGGSAAAGLLGRPVKMASENGTVIENFAHDCKVFLTLHPSPFNYNVARKREQLEWAFERLAKEASKMLELPVC